jgi:PAS domain-containing protein
LRRPGAAFCRPAKFTRQVSLVSLAPWIALVVVLATTGALAIVLRMKRPRRPAARPPAAPAVPEADDRALLRSHALDVLAEAVLITDHDGRVRDCNSSALTLFERHRAAIEEQSAATLRRFEGLDQGDPHRVASQHAVWTGEAWTRQPDGGVKLCQARVIAIRDRRARVTAFAESYRDLTTERALSDEVRDLVYGVRSFDSASASPSDEIRAVREELRLLGEAFRDLDLVIRQYERILPSLSADDPLAESIAGVAHDARTAVAAVGVAALLEEIPRALSRLRGHLQHLTAALGSSTTDAAPEPSSSTTLTS